jgi:hypothetical protein
MMWIKTKDWAARGYGVFTVLFWVFLSLHVAQLILDSQLDKFSDQRNELRMRVSDPNSISTAPADLARAPELLWLGLRVEAPDVAVERLKDTVAWVLLEEKTASYARGMEFMRKQIRLADTQFDRVKRRLSLWSLLTVGLCGLSCPAMLACLRSKSERDRRHRKTEPTAEP